MRSSGQGADAVTDAYSVLGVRPKASILEVRTAWLRLVKELHPDAGFDDPTASEQLKAINLAYQTLKDLDQGRTAGNAELRTYRSARATFVIFLFLPIVAAALMMTARTDWSLFRVATDTATTNEEQQIGAARDTDKKELIAREAHEADSLAALTTGARDPSGQTGDPTGRLGNEPRGDLTILETGAASARADRNSSKAATLQDLNTRSSPSKPNAPRALATLQEAEHEQRDDDASLSGTQRGKMKKAFAADLSDGQTARPRVAEFESDKETRSAIAEAIKSDKQTARSARPSTSVAQSERRWPSADEPFVGADGRIR